MTDHPFFEYWRGPFAYHHPVLKFMGEIAAIAAIVIGLSVPIVWIFG